MADIKTRMKAVLEGKDADKARALAGAIGRLEGLIGEAAEIAKEASALTRPSGPPRLAIDTIEEQLKALRASMAGYKMAIKNNW